MSYERSAFGHGWDAAHGNCQNSRAEALIATSDTAIGSAMNNSPDVSGRAASSPLLSS